MASEVPEDIEVTFPDQTLEALRVRGRDIAARTQILASIVSGGTRAFPLAEGVEIKKGGLLTSLDELFSTVSTLPTIIRTAVLSELDTEFKLDFDQRAFPVGVIPRRPIAIALPVDLWVDADSKSALVHPMFLKGDFDYVIGAAQVHLVYRYINKQFPVLYTTSVILTPENFDPDSQHATARSLVVSQKGPKQPIIFMASRETEIEIEPATGELRVKPRSIRDYDRMFPRLSAEGKPLMIERDEFQGLLYELAAHTSLITRAVQLIPTTWGSRELGYGRGYSFALSHMTDIISDIDNGFATYLSYIEMSHEYHGIVKESGEMYVLNHRLPKDFVQKLARDERFQDLLFPYLNDDERSQWIDALQRNPEEANILVFIPKDRNSDTRLSIFISIPQVLHTIDPDVDQYGKKRGKMQLLPVFESAAMHLELNRSYDRVAEHFYFQLYGWGKNQRPTPIQSTGSDLAFQLFMHLCNLGSVEDPFSPLGAKRRLLPEPEAQPDIIQM